MSFRGAHNLTTRGSNASNRDKSALMKLLYTILNLFLKR